MTLIQRKGPAGGGRRMRRTVVIALLGGGLMGCDGLLDVELPDRVTGEAIQDPGTTQLQLLAILGQVECGLSAFHYHASGYEDNWELVARAYGSYSDYWSAPGGGICDPSTLDYDWYDAISNARATAFQLYDVIENEWAPDQVENREQVLAQTSLYAAIALEVFGQFFCEMALDAGPIMSPDETLAAAEQWATTALGHIATTGDFEMPNGITGVDDDAGIEEFAYAIRGRIRWARGDNPGALQDFARVPDGFTAWITREGRSERRNKVYFHSTPGTGYLHGPITGDVWNDPPAGTFGAFQPPAYGGDWPDPIPFTGYLNLAVTTDGRAVQGYYPVSTETHPSAVDDPRIRVRMQTISAGGDRLWPVAVKYDNQDDDMPLISWREIALIKAEIEGGQAAVAYVDQLRDLHGLPRVAYGPSTPDEIENMIIEERRRELWMEGRYWYTKIRNTDKLWFPRLYGEWPVSSAALQGAVRLAMPEDEYVLNPNLDLSDRGTMCPADEAPVIIG